MLEFWEKNKQIITWVAIALAVVLVIWLAWYFGKGGGIGVLTGGTKGGGGGGAAGPAPSTTRAPVSSNVAVPGTTSTVSGDVAKPSVVAEAAPGSTAKIRIFAISVSGGRFTPDTVIVNVNDRVHLNITAVDKDYDFYQPDYGLFTVLPKGVSKAVEFQASAADKYTFYCKSCGGPKSGPVGYVVVVPQ